MVRMSELEPPTLYLATRTQLSLKQSGLPIPCTSALIWWEPWVTIPASHDDTGFTDRTVSLTVYAPIICFCRNMFQSGHDSLDIAFSNFLYDDLMNRHLYGPAACSAAYCSIL